MNETHLWRIEATASWHSKYGRREWTALEIGFGVWPAGWGRTAGVVWTTDGWLTTHWTAAEWQGNVLNAYGGQDEHWKARLEVGPTNSLVRFTYALFVQDASGQRFWDNNHGANYEQIV